MQAIGKLWPESQGSLSSAHVWQYLINHGQFPPPQGMHAVLTWLQEQRLIQGVAGIAPQPVAQHGALLITWVSPKLTKRAA
jgi:hypothetical protein